MLVNAVLIGARRDCGDGTNAAEMAVGCFSVFLFGLYGTFSTMLWLWREDLIIASDLERLNGIELGEGAVSESGLLRTEEGGEERNDLKMV